MQRHSRPKWTITRVGNGVYTIVNVRSGLNAEVADGRTAKQSVVQQYRSNGAPSQRWMAISRGGGIYSLVGSKSGKALETPSSSTADHARIQIYTLNSSLGQRWVITRVP